MPLRDDLAQRGLRGRPQVRSDQSGEGRAAFDGIPLRSDVDLLAPVDRTLRALASDTGVAAEVRTLHVLDRELVRFGKGEEVACRTVQPLLQLCRDARSGQVEEPDIASGGAQIRAEAVRFVPAAIEPREIEDGEREICHGSTV